MTNLMIPDVWRTHNFIGFILTSVLVPFFYRKRVGVLGAVLWGYMLLSAAFSFSNPFIHGPMQFRFDASAAQAYALLLSVPIFCFEVFKNLFKGNRDGKVSDRIVSGLFIVGVFNAILVLIFGYGIFCSPSMDTTFIALIFPTAFRLVRVYQMKSFKVFILAFIMALFIFTIFTKGGSTGIFVLAATFIPFIFLEFKKYAYALLLLIPFSGWAIASQGWELVSSNGRMNAWNYIFKWWLENVNPFFGSGVGTFEWIGPTIDVHDGQGFLWMHNDYLQILFEGGAIGLLLTFLFLGNVLWRVRHKPAVLSPLCGILVSGLAQFPLRFFLSGVFILFAIFDSVYISDRRT